MRSDACARPAHATNANAATLARRPKHRSVFTERRLNRINLVRSEVRSQLKVSRPRDGEGASELHGTSEEQVLAPQTDFRVAAGRPPGKVEVELGIGFLIDLRNRVVPIDHGVGPNA